MNTDEIIKLAREVGGNDEFTSPPTDWIKGYFVISPEHLSKFAAIVRAAALEEAALVREELKPLRTDAERYRWLRDKVTRSRYAIARATENGFRCIQKTSTPRLMRR